MEAPPTISWVMFLIAAFYLGTIVGRAIERNREE